MVATTGFFYPKAQLVSAAVPRERPVRPVTTHYFSTNIREIKMEPCIHKAHLFLPETKYKDG